jgi:hypothetical protein
MARRSSHVPPYRLHKQSGLAIVTLTGPTGRRKDVLLGPHEIAESRAEYDRVVAEWIANGRRLTRTKRRPAPLRPPPLADIPDPPPSLPQPETVEAGSHAGY